MLIKAQNKNFEFYLKYTNWLIYFNLIYMRMKIRETKFKRINIYLFVANSTESKIMAVEADATASSKRQKRKFSS